MFPDLTGRRHVAEWIRRHEQGPESLSERLRRFASAQWNLYWRAVKMHEEGKRHSYRQFGVGAAALAFRPDRHITEGQASLFLGYNSKETPNGPRHCAERRVFEKAFSAGYKQIVGMVVVRPYQPDDDSGHKCTTLHPCRECRVMMTFHPLAWPGMPLITALPPPEGPIDYDRWIPVHESHVLADILQIHKAAK